MILLPKCPACGDTLIYMEGDAGPEGWSETISFECRAQAQRFIPYNTGKLSGTRKYEKAEEWNWRHGCPKVM